MFFLVWSKDVRTANTEFSVNVLPEIWEKQKNASCCLIGARQKTFRNWWITVVLDGIASDFGEIPGGTLYFPIGKTPCLGDIQRMIWNPPPVPDPVFHPPSFHTEGQNRSFHRHKKRPSTPRQKNIHSFENSNLIFKSYNPVWLDPRNRRKEFCPMPRVYFPTHRENGKQYVKKIFQTKLTKQQKKPASLTNNKGANLKMYTGTYWLLGVHSSMGRSLR